MLRAQWNATPTIARWWLCLFGLVGLLLSFPAVAASGHAMSVVWTDKGLLPSANGPAADIAFAWPNLSIAAADEIEPYGDDARQNDVCCLSITRYDPDSQAYDLYLDTPISSTPVTQTDPVLVTAEFASVDANHTAHVLGIDGVLVQQLREEGDMIALSASSPHQTVMVVLIILGLAAVAGMRYRMRLQRRRWRRVAARRRAQWR